MGRLRKLRLLSTPLGRQHLWMGAKNYLWPQLRPLASAYRGTVARRPRLVAVVGSYGKTTTTAAVCAALGLPPPSRSGSTYASLALRLLRLAPWQRHAAFEVAIDGPGQMAPYAAMLRPDVTVVTSVGTEHHRSLGTLDRTREEKGRMVGGLRPGGTAVLNRDDPQVMAMAVPAGVRVVTFGLDPAADVRATDVRVDWPHGMRLALHVAGATHDVRLKLLGRVMVYPCLAAISVAWVEGIPLERADRRPRGAPAPAGAPAAAAPAPGCLADPRRLQVVAGDHRGRAGRAGRAAGPADRRHRLGLRAAGQPGGHLPPSRRAAGTDRLAGDRRRADVPALCRGRTAAGMPRAALFDARRDVRAAWEAVQKDLAPGDIVLVKGRDTERLDRVALALQGRTVGCEIEFCDLRGVRCETCPRLETGARIGGP